MKRFYKLICFSLLIACNSAVLSQRFSTGFFSGVNISDIRTDTYSGSWKYKPGPVQGIFLDFNQGRYFGITTGLNYSTNYYEHKLYYDNYYPDEYLFYYSLVPYSPSAEVMDFSFMTIPVQLKITIPSKPSLILSPGVYWSFVLDHNLSTYYDHSRKSDFGFLFSAGFSYPVGKDFDILLKVRYLTGLKDFISDRNYHHGSIDFNIGISYNGLFKKSEKTSELNTETDTSLNKVSLVYFIGTGLSWNPANNSVGKYSSTFSPSAGFRIDFPLGEKTEFRTGLSFERTGYAINDSSDVFYGYNIKDKAEYFVDTRTTIDYIEIPASLKFNIGRSNRIYINTGPYIAIKLNARTAGNAWSGYNYYYGFQLIKTVVNDDIGRLIKGNDTGWTFGSGITIPLSGKIQVEAGVQYKIGFRDVFDSSVFSGRNDQDNLMTAVRNRNLSFHFGIKIPVTR